MQHLPTSKLSHLQSINSLSSAKSAAAFEKQVAKTSKARYEYFQPVRRMDLVVTLYHSKYGRCKWLKDCFAELYTAARVNVYEEEKKMIRRNITTRT